MVVIVIGYWKLLLRATQMISRRQEYRAGEPACRSVGSEALVSSLRTIPGSGLAVPAYWSSEVNSVLANGLRPPIAEGFRRSVEPR